MVVIERVVPNRRWHALEDDQVVGRAHLRRRPDGRAFVAADAWREPVTRALLDAGVSRTDARRLATTVVAAIEGAILLCRVRRDIRPLRDVHRALEATLRTAISWHDR